jgi:hypothetical protein
MLTAKRLTGLCFLHRISDATLDNINQTECASCSPTPSPASTPPTVTTASPWCQQHGVVGVTMHPDPADDLIEFRFGGRMLALVPLDVLTGDQPITGRFIADVPDTVPDDLLGGDDK